MPLGWGGGFTLARVHQVTGRKHQIRAHAHWLGYPVVGDKIYGPDDRLYLGFIDGGWTPALAEKLLLPRQALHCAEIDLRESGLDFVFRAPLPDDLSTFCATHGLPVAAGSSRRGQETNSFLACGDGAAPLTSEIGSWTLFGMPLGVAMRRRCTLR